MHEIKQIYRFLRPYRWALPILVVVGAAASLVEGFGLGLLMPFMQEALGTYAVGASSGALMGALNHFANLLGQENRLLLLGLSIIVFIGIKTVLTASYLTASDWIRERVVHDMRCGIADALLTLDYERFSQRNTGEYYNTAIGECARASQSVDAFLKLICRLATMIVFALLLVMISWPLLIISGLLVGGTSLISRVIRSNGQRFSERGIAVSIRYSDRMLRILTGMRTVRAYVQEENEQRAIRAASNEARRSFFRMHASYSLAAPLIEAIFIPFFVAVVLAAPLIGTPVPSLLAFLVIMYRAVPHLRVFEEARVVLSNYSPSVDAIAGILDLSKVATPHLGHPVESLARDIVFDDVSFRYASNSKDNAVEQVSFRIEKGSMVALVGRSGAGKSTLINIMLGFYRPLKGTVLVDGAPLGGLDLQSWRRRIGFAGQDTQLFPGSIAENIAYGRPEVGRTEIEEAARMAAVVEFTSAMPRGLDTEIGRDGTDLSGGQRQRIALARALLLKPDILLLDEATNALDNVTEAAVQNMLQALSGRITILVIAHRLATIRNADWVVALDGGRIAEQGPPAALLRNDAAFARLYRLETMEFSANPDTGEVPRLRESISPDSSGD